MAIWTALAGALSLTNTITPQVIVDTTTINGTGVDVSAAEGDIIIHASALASASDTITYTTEESYDNTTFAAVPADSLVDATGTATTLAVVTSVPANTVQTVYLKKERVRRYIRVTATAAGSSISIPIVVTVIYQKKYANM